jgi:hypothetical protein
MKRRAGLCALILAISLLSGCESCVLPGCDTCEAPCDYACAVTTTDPCAESADTRPSVDWIADLRSADRASRDRAVEALALRGPAVLDQVGPLLTDPDPAVRFSALQVFVRLRTHAWTSVWYVKNRLLDPDASIRADAAYVIGLAGEHGADAIPELICALNDSNPYVRYRAAVAFQRMGIRGSPGLKALERASQCDRVPRVREAARCAISRIERARIVGPDYAAVTTR